MYIVEGCLRFGIIVFIFGDLEGVRLVGEGSCSMGLDLFIVLDEVFREVLLFETILFVSSHLGLN